MACSDQVEKLLRRHADIFDDLAKKTRRDVAAGVIRHCRYPTVRVAKLFMGAALSYLLKAKARKNGDQFS